VPQAHSAAPLMASRRNRSNPCASPGWAHTHAAMIHTASTMPGPASTSAWVALRSHSRPGSAQTSTPNKMLTQIAAANI